MSASYPASAYSWTDRVDSVDDVMAADVNTLAAEIDAIEADLVGAAGTAGGLKRTNYGSAAARMLIEIDQDACQVVNLKISKNATANILDIFAKSTGIAPAAATPIKVMIPDGAGGTLRSRAAAYLSGAGTITMADGAGYWGRASLANSKYIAYVYAIYDANGGIVWALAQLPHFINVQTTATATDWNFMLLETSSTYAKAAGDYCVCVGRIEYEYHTADAPDHTINAVCEVKNRADGLPIVKSNNADGVITIPKQSFVAADGSATHSNSVKTTIVWTNERVDAQAEFDGTTFTAKEAGVYQVSASLLLNGLAFTATDIVYLTFSKNGSTSAGSYWMVDRKSAQATATISMQLKGSIAVPLVSGDTIVAQIYIGRTGGDSALSNDGTNEIFSIVKVA